ncbi:MAG: MotA/TolQ/ExbB proton channel family protein [Henriciella sp.]|jgi:chemotaxis protein MotA|nr:MotA/TolQ/ExbB proton channel family protein [Henriciella sp.]
MIQLVGFVIVLLVVFGGLFISGGPAILAALPFELALIGGAAFGTLLIGNAPNVAKSAMAGFGKAISGSKWKRADYSELLTVLHELTRRAKRGGIVAIEADIEAPEQSELFKSAPRLHSEPQAMALICDSFRLMALDPSTLEHAGERMKDTVADIVEDKNRAVSALHTLADALPALGIVAAVLGIIKTMGVIDESPAVLGEMIAAALLGTFLGVFLAYGLVGPVASRFGQVVEEEALYLDTIANVLGGHVSGLAPRTSIEIARSALPGHLRPNINDLDHAITASRFAPAQAAA